MGITNAEMADAAKIYGEEQTSHLYEQLVEVGKAYVNELSEMGWFWRSIFETAAVDRGVALKLFLIGAGAAAYTFLPNMAAEAGGLNPGLAAFDTDGDGVADVFGLDMDGDGDIDQYLGGMMLSGEGLSGPENYFGLGHVGAVVAMDADNQYSQHVRAEVSGIIAGSGLVLPPDIDQQMVHIEVRSDINRVNAELGRGGVFPGAADMIVFESQLTELGAIHYREAYNIEPTPGNQLFVAIEHLRVHVDGKLIPSMWTIEPVFMNGSNVVPTPGGSVNIPTDFTLLGADGEYQDLLSMSPDGAWQLAVPGQGDVVVKDQGPGGASPDSVVVTGGKFTNFVVSATQEVPELPPTPPGTEDTETEVPPAVNALTYVMVDTNGQLVETTANLETLSHNGVEIPILPDAYAAVGWALQGGEWTGQDQRSYYEGQWMFSGTLGSELEQFGVNLQDDIAAQNGRYTIKSYPPFSSTYIGLYMRFDWHGGTLLALRNVAADGAVDYRFAFTTATRAQLGDVSYADSNPVFNEYLLSLAAQH